MKYAARTATLMLAGFLAMASTCERAAGQHGGGGHGGFGGGHGFGGHSGHSSGASSSGGHSSGHSFGHSIGHSVARLFGHRGPGSSSAVLISAATNRRTGAPPLNSVSKVLNHQGNRLIFRHRNGFFPRRRSSGFAGCSYGWFDFHFGFDEDWNCRNDAFFVDPFFLGWSGPLLYGPAFSGTTWFEGGTAPGPTIWSPSEANPAYTPTDSSVINEMSPSGSSAGSSSNDMKAERPVILLQLRDGSMYGLIDYWTKDDQLHYTTTYGGQDSVPLERIDIEKTVQLNAERGVPFALRNRYRAN